MLKIGSCTVLFNPDRDVISNVETYKDLVLKITKMPNLSLSLRR